MFWEELVTKAGDKLYDGVFLKFILEWITSFTRSRFRPFRHTSTAAAVTIGQAIIEIVREETAEVEVFNRQLESEPKKKRPNSNRIAALHRQISESQDRITNLDAVLDTLFTEIIMQRYKDIMPEVRGLVIKALGMWVIHYPAKFLSQNSFK